MTNQQTSYRQIMKATSLFGGVQIFKILIQIVRSKFIAILLGPSGMGIIGLLNSTLDLIGAMSNFGLGTSAVKNIAEAQGSKNELRIGVVITVLRRLVWITGTLGAIIVFVFSSFLSQLTFGNKNYTLAFIWLSLTLIFSQLTGGQMVLLQGLRKLQYLAKANVYGSTLGLVITIPLYYMFGINGIVPSIIISSLISLILSYFFSKKIAIKPVKVSTITTIVEGKSMLIMGFMISLSGLISTGTSYLLRIFISRQGGIADVGLYSAGFTIIGTYVGLIFSAMSTDYYPRLSSVSYSNELCKQTINQQAEIALLILGPILIMFLGFVNVVIVLLYSTKFIAINAMIYWAALGTFFQAASWSVGFIFLAKGTSKFFFWNELSGSFYRLLFNVVGYYYWGLTGLGMSFLLGYIFYLLQVYLITKFKFEFGFDKSFIKIFGLQFLLALFSFSAVNFIKKPYSYIFAVIITIISIYYSLVELNKRINIISIFHDKLKK